MNEEVLIIEESIFNDQTKRLAKAMADQLDCRCVTIDKAKSLNVDDYKVVGFGSGIYFGMHHPKIIEFVNQLPIKDQKSFIFSTHGSPILGKYHDALRLALNQRGRTVIGEFDTVGFDGTGPFMIFGGGHKGRPHEGDCKRAKQFVRKLLPEYDITDLYLTKLEKKNKITEGHPNVYKIDSVILVGDKVTVNQNRCIGCGVCTEKCPLSVFDISDGKAIPNRELDCVFCQKCLTFCNYRAITLHGSNYDYISVAIRHRKKFGL